ncbi:MAG: hypothetical protein ABIH99_01855 [Candidatus Micrarchaeota archaeon]
MAFATDDTMSTVIDKVVEFIQTRGKTNIAEVEKAFGLDVKKVEQLVTILEDSGLITVKYSMFHPGHTELVAKRLEKSEAESAKKRVKDILEEIDSELHFSEELFLKAEREILQKLMDVEDDIKRIEAKKDELTPDEERVLNTRVEEMRRGISKFEGDLSLLERRLKEMDRRSLDLKKKRRNPLSALFNWAKKLVKK